MDNKNIESIYETLAKTIKASELTDDKKTEALSRLLKIKEKTVGILLVGPTAAGKSSTINALFNMERARIGTGVDPETTSISKYELENLNIYDAPGLGDSLQRDKSYIKMIKNQLMALDDRGTPIIDLVLVIADASQKDLGTVYSIVNDVLIPVLGKEAEHRILIGLNKADMAMCGRHWCEELNSPDEVLTKFLDKKAASVQHRIAETTGITYHPICYAAGYKEEGYDQRPYNIVKLLYAIVSAIPKEKRLAMADVLNPDPRAWEFSDGKSNYQRKTADSFWEAIKFLLNNIGVVLNSTFNGISTAFGDFWRNLVKK